MPSIEPSEHNETPGQRTMRRWYEMRIAERLMQAASLAANRALMRRGARKMQDGTLGQPGAEDVEDEPVQIRIGDEIHWQATPSSSAQQQSSSPLWRLAIPLLAILLGGGAGAALPYLIGALGQPKAQVQQTSPPRAADTINKIEIGGGNPTLEW